MSRFQVSMAQTPGLELLAGFAAVEIPHSGHWPVYSNPVTMWDQTAGFQARNKLG
jgi:hypothetical protein